MPKRTNIRQQREMQFLRAATIHAERILRYDTDRNYTINEIADMGMIRKRWIRQACIDSPNIKAVRRGKETAFQYDGTPPYTNPYATGIDPSKLKRRKK